jgi:hypothetical protein
MLDYMYEKLKSEGKPFEVVDMVSTWPARYMPPA